MSLHEDYNSKESTVALLQDFLSYIAEEYENNANFSLIFSSTDAEEYIEKIKSLLEEYFPTEIFHKFSELTEAGNAEELFDFVEFESRIAEISADIERLTYRKGNEIVDGVYLSDLDDVSINAIWNSNAMTGISTIKTVAKNVSDNQVSEEQNIVIEAPDIKRCWLNSDTAMQFVSSQTKSNHVAWSSFNNNYDIVFSVPMITSLLKIEISLDDVIDQCAFFAPFNLDDFIAYYKENQGYELQIPEDEFELNRVLRFATISIKSDMTISVLACQEYSDDRKINRLHYITHSTEKDCDWHKIIKCNHKYFSELKGTTENPENVDLTINKYTSFFTMFNYWLLSFETNEAFAVMTNEIKSAIENVTQRLSILKKFKSNMENDEPDEDGKQKSVEEKEFDSIIDGMWWVNYRVKEIIKLHVGLKDGIEYSPEQIAKKMETTENVVLDAEYMFMCKIQKLFGDDKPPILQKIINCLKRDSKPLHAVLMDTPLDDLCFTVRTYNCLHRAGIRTLRDITERTEEDMIRVRNLGRRSLEEVIFYLQCHGLCLKSDSAGPETIDDLDLSVRAYNTLKRRKLIRISDILERTVKDISLTALLGKKSLFEILKKLDEYGLRLKDCPKDQYSSIDDYIATEGEKFSSTREISDFDFMPRVNHLLKRAGINDFDKLLNSTPFELLKIPNFGWASVAQVMKRLDDKGYRLNGCRHNEFSTIEEFIVKNFSCRDCGCSLSVERDNVILRKCSVCDKRAQRIERAELITLDVRPPEYSNFTKGGNGFAIYVNINNNTDEPLKLKLQECSVFSNGRQRASEYTYTGYSFDEEYVFPNIIKTLGKIWITESWTTPNLVKGDVFTISFKDASNKIYFFKYVFNDIGQWEFNDYYELD